MILFKHPIIFFSNIVKVGGIWFADLINWIWNPFDKFTRPMILKRAESLDAKAVQFAKSLNNVYDMGIVYNSTINWDGTPSDVGDQSLWHGITVAMLAIKYSVIKDPTDLENLRQGMVGLDLHQTAHGEPVRRLIRGVTNPAFPQATFIDDVSNDGTTGHLAGIYYAWKYGDDQIKQQAEVLIRGLADELLNHNYCLVGPDGNPTTYGRLIDGWKTDPLGLTLCMAIFTVAYNMTWDLRYKAARDVVQDIYGSAGLYKYPKVSFLTFNNWNDDHRAAIHLSILNDLMPMQEFTDGLKRIWRLNKNTGNAWIAYLCGQHFNISKEELQPCITLLNEFYIEDMKNTQKLNSNDPEKINDLGIEFNEYTLDDLLKGDLITTQPLPLWWSGAQDFRWQRRPYSVDDWVGNVDPSQWFFGCDFLIAYWGFKQQGWL